MDVAQIYMLALRPTMIPIAGESAAALPFTGQVELEGWSWNIHNAEEKVLHAKAVSKASKKSGERSEAAAKKLKERFESRLEGLNAAFDEDDIKRLDREKAAADKRMREAFASGKGYDAAAAKADDLQRQLDEIRKRQSAAVKQINTANKERTAEEKRRDEDRARQREDVETEQSIAEDIAENFQLSFSKRFDVSSTQLLNCMKAGDLLPTVTLTLHQASSNTPWTLVITLTSVRILDYKVKVEVTDTMSDMREDWVCEFKSLGYVYQNRPHAGIKSLTSGGATTVAGRAASQGTVRTFLMVNRDFF